ncbi:MAG: DUF4405 domain-containing protein [bacterium]
MQSKQRSKLNFVIDVLMFIVMMAIGGIGFLMKFVLVRGSQVWEIYGENLDLLLWGWDRHQWGSLHLILGYILLGLLVLHIVFHWKQIGVMFKCLITKKFFRIILTIILIILSLLFFLFAFIVEIDKVTLKRGEGRHRLEHIHQEEHAQHSTTLKQEMSISSEVKKSIEENNIPPESSAQVEGRMTLYSIEATYKVPADSLKKFLGIPLSCSDRENLGQLRRRYNFHMSDVERYIEKYQKNHNITTQSKIHPTESEDDKDYRHKNQPVMEVYGSMTLKDLEQEYQVPADSIKNFLGISLRISDYENLGRLRRRYGFHMSDVERYIEKYAKTHL